MTNDENNENPQTTMLHASGAIYPTTTPSTRKNKEESDGFFESRFKKSYPLHGGLKIPHCDPTLINVVGIGGVGRRSAPTEQPEAVRFDGRVALAKSNKTTREKDEKKPPPLFSPIFRIVADGAGGLGSGRDDTVVVPLGGIRTDPTRGGAAMPVVVVGKIDKQQEKQNRLVFLGSKPTNPNDVAIDGETDFENSNSKLSHFDGNATTDEVVATKAVAIKQQSNSPSVVAIRPSKGLKAVKFATHRVVATTALFSWAFRWTLVLLCLCVCFVSVEAGTCFSDVGDDICTSSGTGNGEEMCENHSYDQDQCAAIGCCEWSGGGGPPTATCTTPCVESETNPVSTPCQCDPLVPFNDCNDYCYDSSCYESAKTSSGSGSTTPCVPSTGFAPADGDALKAAVESCLYDSGCNGCRASCSNDFAASQDPTGNPYGPMNDWDVSRVVRMDGLFRLKGGFNADISCWNTSQVVNMVSFEIFF